MGYVQNYFPPRVGKYEWGTKSLNYSPWYCNFLKQRLSKDGITDAGRLRIDVSVDEDEPNVFWSYVEVRPIVGDDFSVVTKHATAEEAIKVAEEFAEQVYDQQLPNWALIALKAGWRTP